MQNKPISTAAVSADPEIRQRFRTAMQELAGEDASPAEVTVPFDQIGADELNALRSKNPELVFLDLRRDAATGIRFARFLSDSNPRLHFVATGPELEPALLMEGMRAGISEYLPHPMEREQLTTALARLQRKLGGTNGSAAPSEPGQLLAVFSAKGGSGSTTVATNLAIHLQKLTGKRTLLVDLDLELGEIAVLLGMQPRFNFVDMVRNFHRMDADLLASYIEKHPSGVHLLSAPFHPERSETVPADAIRRIFAFLKNHYEYIIVDTSKSFSAATLSTFEQADRILLVSTVDLPSLRNLKRCMPLLDRITGATASDRVRLVLNRVQSGDVITKDEVERAVGLDVFWSLSNDYESVMKSINTGQPVISNGHSRFAQDLKSLGIELAGLRDQKVATAKKRRSLALPFFGRKELGVSHAG